MSAYAEQTGMLAESDWWGGVSQQENCVGEGTSWRMIAGVSADGDEQQEWHQIEDNGSNIWRFFSHFDSDYLPDNATSSDCPDPYGEPWPENFEYQIVGGEDPSNLYFTSTRPQDGDTKVENEELNVLLDIAGGLRGTYTHIGAVSVKYLMDSSETVSVSYSNLNSEVNCDVPLDGSLDDFPQGSNNDANVAEVAVRVKNEFSNGLRSVYFLPKFTFSHIRTPTAGTTCYCNYNYRNYVTTAPDNRLSASYTAVE